LQGLAKVTEINATYTQILLSNSKSTVLNVMLLKKFFPPDQNNQSETVSQDNDLNFYSEPKVTGPMMRAMRKLIDHKNAAQLAINVLCDLSKKHCSMCKWEQDCSDNPLLLNPYFSQQYIKERCSWLINK